VSKKDTIQQVFALTGLN